MRKDPLAPHRSQARGGALHGGRRSPIAGGAPPPGGAGTRRGTATAPVDLFDPDGVVVARGLVAYDARELPPLLGRKTSELDPEYQREIVHRDEMVLVRRPSLG